MLTERTTTLFVSIFYFQKCQTREYRTKIALVNPGKTVKTDYDASAIL